MKCVVSQVERGDWYSGVSAAKAKRQSIYTIGLKSAVFVKHSR